MKKRMWLSALVLACLVVAISGFLSEGRFELLAASPIEVKSHLGPDTVKSDRVVATIAVGQSVHVVKCHDLKHYVVPEVRLPDGQSGYVYDGDYKIIKSERGFLDFLFDPFNNCSLMVSDS